MSGAVILEVGDVVPVVLQVVDGSTGLYPQAEIRDDQGNLLTTLDLSHEASGLYVPDSPYQMPNKIFIKVTYITYTDDVHTVESEIYMRDVDIFVSIVPGDYKADVSALALDLTFLKDIEGGDWKRDGTQMIFYKAGGAEVARFNLFKFDGTPATEQDVEVAERQRV